MRRALVALLTACVFVPAVPASAVTGDDAGSIGFTAPRTLFCGQTATVSVTMRNIGTTTWTSPSYTLRSLSPAGRWGVTSVPLPSSAPPGQQRLFSFTVTAPTTPGRYTTQWQMANGTTNFGEPTLSKIVIVTCPSSAGHNVGYREVTGTKLNDLYLGNARIERDMTFSAPEVLSHTETSTVYYGGRYLMFYRQTDGAKIALAGVSTCGWAISVAASTDGGVTWSELQDGKPVLAIANDTVAGPAVVIDVDPATQRPRLTMAYEHRPGCAGDFRVARAYSNDGLIWTDSVDVVPPGGAGTWQVGTGTPQLVKTPDGVYRVGYHGNNGGDDDPNSLKVGFAYGPTLDGTSPTTPPVLTQTGPVIDNTVGTWATHGVGRGDVVKEDGYWYMVVEGLRGSSGCNELEVSSWGLLRTADPTLRSGWQSSTHNPIRIDRVGRRCGEDMPSFQVVNGEAYVLTTGKDMVDADGAPVPGQQPQRYRIVSGARGRILDNVVGMAPTPSGNGYWEVTTAGQVYAYGDAQFHGNVAQPFPGSIVGIAAKPSGSGYWVATNTGRVYNFGDAADYGDLPRSYPSFVLAAPVVGIAAAADGSGHWLVGADGGVFAFGAGYYGSAASLHLNKPAVGIGGTPSGHGYWIVASDGGIFAYGDAVFHGALGSLTLNQPIVGIAPEPDGTGYWLVGKDGGIFGMDAQYLGSTRGLLPLRGDGTTTSWIVGVAAHPSGTGYWLVADDGGILEIGSAGYFHDPSYAFN